MTTLRVLRGVLLETFFQPGLGVALGPSWWVPWECPALPGGRIPVRRALRVQPTEALRADG